MDWVPRACIEYSVLVIEFRIAHEVILNRTQWDLSLFIQQQTWPGTALIQWNKHWNRPRTPVHITTMLLVLRPNMDVLPESIFTLRQKILSLHLFPLQGSILSLHCKLKLLLHDNNEALKQSLKKELQGFGPEGVPHHFRHHIPPDARFQRKNQKVAEASKNRRNN